MAGLENMIPVDYQVGQPVAGRNLMEKEWVRSDSGGGVKCRWFNEARFGIFIHYGLYSLLGRGEWALYNERIPCAEYNTLARRFQAEEFDADRLAEQIVRTGARYAVLTARHHDGYCLWDSRTTNFTSTKTPVGRDLIAEYVAACRRHGLKVGIYHSLMNWQREANFSGPEKDRVGWEEMVQETHAQVRELMTDYGKVDVLWYDGCMVPGLDVDRAACWKSRELNAMVRQLQPGILINDRSALPEDFSTPEQELRPPPVGRLWECCMTMGQFWGWHERDTELKSSRELLEQMIFCARHGGNFLLNIAPHGDGSLSAPQQQRLEEIGAWMRVKGESLYGTKRSRFTEAAHLCGTVTAKRNRVYLHLGEGVERSVRVAGLTSRVRRVRMMGGEDISFRQDAAGMVSWPCSGDPEGLSVAEIELEGPVPRKAPPEILQRRLGGRREVDDEPVHGLEGLGCGDSVTVVLPVEATGRYRLELEIEAEEALEGELALEGKRCKRFTISGGGYPQVVRTRGRVFREGAVEVGLREFAGKEFRLSRWRLVPEWREVEAWRWMVSKAIATEVDRRSRGGMTLKRALEESLGPELSGKPDEEEVLAGRWRHCEQTGCEMNFSRMYPEEAKGVWFAHTVIGSPDERMVAVLLACDWWANLYVNGEKVRSERPREEVAYDGAEFNGWKPQPARIRLRKGLNDVLVKCHPGDIDSWIELRINDAGDLQYAREH